jgi:ATP-dependent Clp protease ATP-binding subunit ClpX
MIAFQPSAMLARIGRLFRPPLACSFCGRNAEQVERLVAGASAHICDNCITQCLDVLERHPVPPRPPTEADRP